MLAGMGHPRILSAFAWAPLQKAFLWWGLSPGRRAGAAPAVTFLAWDLLYSLALKHLEQLPSGLIEPFAVLTCLLQDTSQNLVLILMQIGAVSVRNYSLPYPRPGFVPSLCWLHVLLHPAAVLPAQALTGSFLAAALMRTSRCAW